MMNVILYKIIVSDFSRRQKSEYIYEKDGIKGIVSKRVHLKGAEWTLKM
jgi:hypothetical protein